MKTPIIDEVYRPRNAFFAFALHTQLATRRKLMQYAMEDSDDEDEWSAVADEWFTLSLLLISERTRLF